MSFLSKYPRCCVSKRFQIKGKKYSFATLYLALIFLSAVIVFSSFPSFVHAQKEATENSQPADMRIKDVEKIDVSSQDLEGIVTVLQDEQKRADFLNKLQTLRAVSEDQKEVTIAKGIFQNITSWFADKYALAREMLKSSEGIKILITRSVLSVILLVAAIWGLKFMNRKVFDTKNLHFALKYGSDIVLAAAALSILLLIWNVNLFGMLGLSVWKQLIISLLSIGIIIVVAIVVWRIINTFLSKQEDYLSGDQGVARRANTLFPLLRKILRVVLIIVTILIILPELGVNVAPLLAGLGVLGIAVGFGAQTLVKDFINGFFILAEDSIHVGDWVALGGHDGQVEGLSIRNIRLRDIYGNVYTIPWGSVDTVKNQTREFGYAVVEPGVAYRENINEVIEVVKQVASEMQQDPDLSQDILSDLQILGLIELGDSAVIVRARFKTAPFKRWYLEREFRKRLKIRFDELGIEIPFPHSTVYFGQDKQGDAPPARLNITKEIGAEG